jgi:hypothetical protein
MLAIADGESATNEDWDYLVELNSMAISQIAFPKSSANEVGTYMPAFSADGQLLISPRVLRQENGPLRRYNPTTGLTDSILSTRTAMISASADRSTIALTQFGNTSRPVSLYHTATGQFTNGAETSSVKFEIAVSRIGSQFAVPTYYGTHVYDDSFNDLGSLGEYTQNGAIGVVYSPTEDVFYASWYRLNENSRDVLAFSATTLQQVGSFDAYGVAAGRFNWHGGLALQEGRLRISQDGSLLFATIDGGVSIINLVPEPSAIGAFAIAGVGLLMFNVATRRRD